MLRFNAQFTLTELCLHSRMSGCQNNFNIYTNYAELNYIYFIYCYKTEITERQLNCTRPTYPRSIVSAQTTVII
jgi:hypothetical protein